MTHFLTAALFLLVTTAPLCSSAGSVPGQQQTGRTVTESPRVASAARTRTTSPRSTKAVTTPAKSATVAAAKTKSRPGNRFWSRIMGAFRDIHSAEKKNQ